MVCAKGGPRNKSVSIEKESLLADCCIEGAKEDARVPVRATPPHA
jgi:hypothetical protein